MSRSVPRSTSAAWGSAPPDRRPGGFAGDRDRSAGREAAVVTAPGLLDLRLVFVTGKGGVGKTTVAAALAQLAAERGKRVLACEVDAKGDLSSLFEAAPTGFTEREIAPGV